MQAHFYIDIFSFSSNMYVNWGGGKMKRTQRICDTGLRATVDANQEATHPAGETVNETRKATHAVTGVGKVNIQPTRGREDNRRVIVKDKG